MPLLDIAIALLMVGLSIPLVLRKVPMNSIYGVRFPQSFKSNEAWYEINAYGGKALLIAAIPVFLTGCYGLIWKPTSSGSYSLVSSAVLLISVMLAALASYLKARKIDQATSRRPD